MTNKSTERTVSLAEASVQQIQFELLRRSAISVEYAELIEPLIDVLRTHPDLWTGMVIDRIHLGHRGHGLLPMTMMPLRDIGTNFWNADTLYLLCPTRPAADALAALLPMDRFGCMIDVYDEADQLGSAMGEADDGVAILRAWWD